MFTKKGKKILKGICVLHQNDNNVSGIIKLLQLDNKLKIEYEIKGLKDGLHGFHIHEYGDLTDNCKNACNHFNPNKNHGSNNSKERHLGDLGNISSKNNISKGVIYNNSVSLDLKKIILLGVLLSYMKIEKLHVRK